MTGLTLDGPGAVSGKLLGYVAKDNIEHFPRKKIPSYALWSVYIKEGHRYPKIPQGYGAAGNYEDAHNAMMQFIADNNIDFNYCRTDGLERWARIKQLIVIRDFSQIPRLKWDNSEDANQLLTSSEQ